MSPPRPTSEEDATYNALAAGSGYLRDVACGGAGNDTILADDGGDAGQVTGDSGTHGCTADTGDTVHYDE